MAGRTHFRRLDGLLLLDKPQGMSSNAALQLARRLFRAEKGGHTGSLDPLATGLLPLCFGEATKIAGLLLGSRKAYDTVAITGTTTDTDDADGAPLRERPVPALDEASVRAALAPLLGRIRQRAPIYSALKQGGEPLEMDRQFRESYPPLFPGVWASSWVSGRDARDSLPRLWRDGDRVWIALDWGVEQPHPVQVIPIALHRPVILVTRHLLLVLRESELTAALSESELALAERPFGGAR